MYYLIEFFFIWEPWTLTSEWYGQIDSILAYIRAQRFEFRPFLALLTWHMLPPYIHGLTIVRMGRLTKRMVLYFGCKCAWDVRVCVFVNACILEHTFCQLSQTAMFGFIFLSVLSVHVCMVKVLYSMDYVELTILDVVISKRPDRTTFHNDSTQIIIISKYREGF